MKKHLLTLVLLAVTLVGFAQTPPSIHVEGRNLVDTHGNTVVMHGVMDTPSCWFNGGRWGWMSYDDANAPTKCVNYFETIFKHLTDNAGGTYCDVFRLHLDPCWTNGSKTATGFTKKGDQWYDPDGVAVGGEADIHAFDKARLSKFFTSVYWKIIDKALKHGMHVVVRPPGVCPQKIRVGGYYQEYLMTVWDFVSSQTNMKKYAGQVSIELANEPVSLVDAEGKSTPQAMHDFFQPIVDKIRANGFTGIIWVPGTGYQSNYREYESYPIEGYNIGYAVHVYPGWYGNSDENASGTSFIKNFGDAVPVVKTNPIIVTEIDWSPGHLVLDENGNPIDKGDGNYKTENYGTWGTARTSTWGNAWKAVMDHFGNISMTLSATGCLINEDAAVAGKTVIAHGDKEKPEEGCAYACAEWYKEYAKVDNAYPDYTNLSTNLSSDKKKFINPVIAADFPDPDVTRLGDTYYMLSTTMYLQPGATVLKSKDLVNWEFCCNPLEQLSSADKYSLIDGQHSYAGGMWAGAIEAHDGKLYILINGNDAGGYVLSTDNPEGKWDMKKLSRSYYDPGMIFEGDKIYIVCGINHLNICELDKDWNFIKETNVVKVDDKGLEGSHLYHIGDYYYIYATYGGWPTGQTIFRSKNITGPYEEKLLIDKVINNVPNTVHQGALIEIPETGEWWTMLMEDKGAIGRLPSLHPVTWADGWPTLCKDGVPQLTYTRPNVGTTYAESVLPTNDNFRHYLLGKQWQWNHNNPAGQWSLLERPGFLRLRTSSVADDLMLARGTLTQRIFAYHKKTTPYGIDTTQPSIATIALDASNMQPGDMAGIAVQQDPYAMLAVTRDEAGAYSLVWKNGSHTNTDNFPPATKTLPIPELGQGQGSTVIYLRAKFDNSNSQASFLYSLDNKTWKEFGSPTGLRFNLSVFVGARWAIFNYATEELGGYVDIDWFTTEAKYEEATFGPADFAGYSQDMLTATEVSAPEDIVLMTGNKDDVTITATFQDGHTENVAANCTYRVANEATATAENGSVRGIIDGTTDITAIYTDPMGNEFRVTFAAKVATFPLLEKYVDARMFGDGYFKEETGELHLTQYGCGGWWFRNGLDLTPYKYLVLKFKKAPMSGCQLHIYDENNYWASAADISLSTAKTQKILLTKKYKKSNNSTYLDLSNIRIFGIWVPSATSLYIEDIFLSDDGKVPVGIDDILTDEPSDTPAPIYDLQGRRISRPTRGIYIQGGRKVLIK